ncbi:uncharacterized protein EI90DRAFT_3131977 [Cantharellus anzutake]|uniref:uncharacterized protein n=1 Tax=Cantharellus anzutake TaxID=1750568 RepID=UPI001904D926|nr:uncharacterized protein EI90DRAFT_3131977 [Cantharellus anzutake]KAF8320619.1 hypothetical protein EI90DRAFT_3131977 [Cantharellus anzutake]
MTPSLLVYKLLQLKSEMTASAGSNNTSSSEENKVPSAVPKTQSVATSSMKLSTPSVSPSPAAGGKTSATLPRTELQIQEARRETARFLNGTIYTVIICTVIFMGILLPGSFVSALQPNFKIWHMTLLAQVTRVFRQYYGYFWTFLESYAPWLILRSSSTPCLGSISGVTHDQFVLPEIKYAGFFVTPSEHGPKKIFSFNIDNLHRPFFSLPRKFTCPSYQLFPPTFSPTSVNLRFFAVPIACHPALEYPNIQAMIEASRVNNPPMLLDLGITYTTGYYRG